MEYVERERESESEIERSFGKLKCCTAGSCTVLFPGLTRLPITID